MIISKKSILTGVTSEMDIAITFEQLENLKCNLVQNVVPNLSVEEREFLISGITPEEWDKMVEDESV